MPSLPAARDSELALDLRSVARSELVAGRYRILATLGRGGMADVYLGAATGPAGFNKFVVIKRLRSGDEDPGLVEMFLDEARLAGRLNHPNIVHTYEVDDSPDGYLLIMEYLEGQSLRRLAKAIRAREGRFDPALASYLVAEALEGLHYVHEMRDYDGSPLGVVHRDVSPQNLFVTYDGQVKVLDFGIAKGALNVTDTLSGVLKGKVSYMAPEQAKEGLVDRRADVFSAGVVLWELLTGDKLFKGDTVATLHSLITASIEAPSSLVRGIPPELDRIVLKALSRSADGRFATALAMSKALSDFVRRSGRVIRREDVAGRMQDFFGEARETMAKRIQAYMASRSNAASTSSDPLVPASDRPTRSDPAGPSSGMRLAIQKRKWLPVATASVALMMLVVAGFVVVRWRLMAKAALARSAVTNELSAAARADAEQTFHLTLSSDPPEAQVEWGGNVVGQTPMLIDLATGPQTFVLSRDGYFKGTVVLNVTDGMTGRAESRSVVLIPRPKVRPAGAVAAPAVRAATGTKASNPSTVAAGAAPAVAATATALIDPFGILPGPPSSQPSTKASAAAAPANVSPASGAPPAAAATSNTPTAAPAVLPFGPEMTRPTLVSGGELVYPREAMVAGVAGTIIAKCTITTEGTVRDCRIIKGLPFLDKATLDTLATRRYSPVMRQGKTVPVEYVFNLKVAPPNTR